MAQKRRSDHELAEEIASRLTNTPYGGRGVAADAMVMLQRARDSGGGGLRQQCIAEAQRCIAKLDPARHGPTIQRLQAGVLALRGRGGDTRVAHVTPGEIVVPPSLQTPQFLNWLRSVAKAQGIDPARLVVGSNQNSINPKTGQPEFLDDDGQEIEEITVATPREQGLVELPQNLPNSGFYSYGTPGNGAAQYGLASTMGVIGAAGSQWNSTGAAPFGVGNMSLSDGSRYDGHGRDHMNGTGVDIRPVRNDGLPLPVSWNDPAYNRDATQKLVDTLNQTGGVQRILFNDPNINGVEPWDGHDNHMHVTVNPSWER